MNEEDLDHVAFASQQHHEAEGLNKTVLTYCVFALMQALKMASVSALCAEASTETSEIKPYLISKIFFKKAIKLYSINAVVFRFAGRQALNCVRKAQPDSTKLQNLTLLLHSNTL